MKKFLLTILVFTFITMSACYASANNNKPQFGRTVSSSILPLNDQIPSIDYSQYINYISKKVQNTWRPQSYHKNLSLTVHALFKNDGTIRRYKVVESSGYKDVDFTALAALQVNSPYEKFPEGATDKYIKVKFVFDRYLIGTVMQNSSRENKLLYGTQTTTNTPQGDLLRSYNSIPVNTNIQPTQELENYVYDQLTNPAQKDLCKEYLDYITATIQQKVLTDDNMPLSYFRFNIKKDGTVENVRLITSSDGKVKAEEVAIQISKIIFRGFPQGLNFKNNKVTVEYQFGEGLLDEKFFNWDDSGENYVPFTDEDVRREERIQAQPQFKDVPLFVPITEDEISL